jgi:hypothetical protein
MGRGALAPASPISAAKLYRYPAQSHEFPACHALTTAHMEDSRGQPSEHQDGKTPDPQEQSGYKLGRRPIEVAIVSQVPIPPNADNEPCQKCQEKTPRWKKLLEFIAVGLAVMVAAIYGGQLLVMKRTLDEMKGSGSNATQQANQVISNLNWLAQSMDGTLKQSQRALDASIQTSRLDQRAWLSSQIATPLFEEGKPMLVINEFSNTGKTPALGVQTCQVLEAVEYARKEINLRCGGRAQAPGLSIIRAAFGTN